MLATIGNILGAVILCRFAVWVPYNIYTGKWQIPFKKHDNLEPLSWILFLLILFSAAT